MPQYVLGLDLGSYSVKAALFETTFRSFELTDLFESPPLQADHIAPEDKPVVATEAILRLLNEHRIVPSTVITALPGNVVSTRVMTLPLQDRQVAKVLPFELEAYLPFDLEELLLDHHVLHTGKGQTTLLAAATRKAALAEHLAIVRGASLEPAFVTLDSLALYNLNQLALTDIPGTYAIVDVGHQKTSICIVSNGTIQSVRTLFTAGYLITETIQKDLDLTWEQAGEVKHQHGMVALEGQELRSQDLKRLAAAIRKAVDPLVRDIGQTFHVFQAQKSAEAEGEGAPAAIERIYLAGGTSLLRNLPEYLHQATGIPVSSLRLFPEGHEVSARLGKKESVFAQAVSLGLRAASRGAKAKRVASVNFRQGEFSFARDLSGLYEKVRFLGKWTAAIFLLALVQVGFRYHNLSRQNAQLEETILATFRQIAPDEKNVPDDPSLALKMLQARIGKFRQKQEVLTAGLHDTTALGILREISSRIPADVPIDAQELSIDRNKVTLRGNTDSFASVDKIIAALKDYPAFKRIEKGDIREAASGKKSFQATILIGGEP